MSELLHFLPSAFTMATSTLVGNTERLGYFGYLVLSTQNRSFSSLTFANFHIKNPHHWNVLLHQNDIAERAKPLDVKALNFVHTFEEIVQFFVRLNRANMYWTEELM